MAPQVIKSAFAVQNEKKRKASGTLKIKLKTPGKVKTAKKSLKRPLKGTQKTSPPKKTKQTPSRKSPPQAHSKKSPIQSPSKKTPSKVTASKVTVSKVTPSKILKPTNNKKSLKQTPKTKSTRKVTNTTMSPKQPAGKISTNPTPDKNSPKQTPINKKSPKLTLGKKSPKQIPDKKSQRQNPGKKSPKQSTPKTSAQMSSKTVPDDKVSRSSSKEKCDLTPKSLAVATKKAAISRPTVLVTPIKQRDMNGSEDNSRKRKYSKPVSKNAKKLKIKLSSDKKKVKQNRENPRIVMATSPEEEFVKQNGPCDVYDSGKDSALLFEWLISPVGPVNFFENLWEKKPLLIRRHKPEYFKGLFTTSEFNTILKENDIQFGTNIDVTSYTNGQRETHNPEGRAHAPVVWDYFNNGCSVRLLNPQTYSTKVWKLLSVLQENFGSFCGANVYLTPAATQGFAPHYDDIEAFILQLEGKKRWKLYSPRNENELLPRLSSVNFTDEDIGSPILDTVLEEGDVLYFPRGYIHQAAPPSDSHSLHLTVSTFQKNTWGDLMGKLVSQALQVAIEEDVDFRSSLPRDYLHYMGLINSDFEDDGRKAFLLRIRDLFGKLASFAPVDGAVDQMAEELLHSNLPPVLTEEETSCMVYGSKVLFQDGEFVTTSKEITDDTEIQLIRGDVLRLINRDDEIHIHHCMENTRVYHSKPPQYFTIPAESAPGVEFLVFKYPKFVKVRELPLEGDFQGKELELATLLFEKGLVRTKYPFSAD